MTCQDNVKNVSAHSDWLQQATWDSQVDVAPPPAYTIMLVKMKKLDNTTVREAVKVWDFLVVHLMFEGYHGILCLAGLANDSLSEGNIGPMLQRLQHKKDSVLAAGVDVVTFVKLVKQDVASGGITPDPNVSLHVHTCHQSTHTYICNQEYKRDESA